MTLHDSPKIGALLIALRDFKPASCLDNELGVACRAGHNVPRPYPIQRIIDQGRESEGAPPTRSG